MDRIDKNINDDYIRFYLKDKEKLKLNMVVKELFKSKSIDKENIDEFLKLTVFIVLHEYDKNKTSLNEFYRQNRELYKQNNEEEP